MNQAEAKKIIDLVKLVSEFEEASKQRTFVQNIAVLSRSTLYQVGQHKILVVDDGGYRVDGISVQVVSNGNYRIGDGVPVKVLDENTYMIWDSYFDSEGKKLKK